MHRSNRLLRSIASKVFRAFVLVVAFSLIPRSITAFVFLDTSAKNEKDVAADSVPVPVAPGITIGPTDAVKTDSLNNKSVATSSVKSTALPGLPHYGNVLFLSSDTKMVFAYLGVLQALEEYGLDIDLVLTESKAAWVGAAWALGYSSDQIRKQMVDKPFENYLNAYPEQSKANAEKYIPDGKAPWQWAISLGIPSFQDPASNWSEYLYPQSSEFLHLSWLIAKLTHDAPGGPVEELLATPKPLAVQVADLEQAKEEVVTTGSLQNLLKGALLPTEALRRRKQLWPYASGSIRSGHRIMQDKLPFTFDRLILIVPGAHLHPPILGGPPLPWIDSLELSRQNDAGERSWQGQSDAKVIRIEIEPRNNFNPREPDPKKWIDLGYVSTLRTMDVLMSVLAHKPDNLPSPGAADPATFHKSLELNRVSINPLASGGRQLLLDLIRTSENGEEDSIGDGPISEILNSGFYTDLDLEWTRAVGEEKASLVFDAKDKSIFRFRAGLNAALTQAKISDRSPELCAGLVWEEPFYIPFRSEADLLLGGYRPGYQGRIMFTPLYPLRFDLGVATMHWDIHYPPAPDGTPGDPIWFWLQRDLSEVFLQIYPTRGSYLRTSIQKHEMYDPGYTDPNEGKYLSKDLEETGYLKLGKPNSGKPPWLSLWARYRYLFRVNLFGPIKDSTSNFEGRLRLSFGDFRISDQYYWSDQKLEGATLFEFFESGRINAFSFQDEYFLGSLRSPNFQDFKLEYCPVFGKAGIRLSIGGYQNYGGYGFFADQVDKPIRFHWETQAGYATPLGYLRAGMGGRDGEKPFYYVKLGADFELGFGELD